MDFTTCQIHTTQETNKPINQTNKTKKANVSKASAIAISKSPLFWQ